MASVGVMKLKVPPWRIGNLRVNKAKRLEGRGQQNQIISGICRVERTATCTKPEILNSIFSADLIRKKKKYWCKCLLSGLKCTSARISRIGATGKSRSLNRLKLFWHRVSCTEAEFHNSTVLESVSVQHGTGIVWSSFLFLRRNAAFLLESKLAVNSQLQRNLVQVKYNSSN